MDSYELRRRIWVREEALRCGLTADRGTPYTPGWRRRLACELDWYRKELRERGERADVDTHRRRFPEPFPEPPPPPRNVVRVDFARRRRG